MVFLNQPVFISALSVDRIMSRTCTGTGAQGLSGTFPDMSISVLGSEFLNDIIVSV
jgi:hypothetical protein